MVCAGVFPTPHGFLKSSETATQTSMHPLRHTALPQIPGSDPTFIFLVLTIFCYAYPCISVSSVLSVCRSATSLATFSSPAISQNLSPKSVRNTF